MGRLASRTEFEAGPKRGCGATRKTDEGLTQALTIGGLAGESIPGSRILVARAATADPSFFFALSSRYSGLAVLPSPAFNLGQPPRNALPP